MGVGPQRSAAPRRPYPVLCNLRLSLTQAFFSLAQTYINPILLVKVERCGASLAPVARCHCCHIFKLRSGRNNVETTPWVCWSFVPCSTHATPGQPEPSNPNI